MVMAQSLTDTAILQAALIGLEQQEAELDSKVAEIRRPSLPGTVRARQRQLISLRVVNRDKVFNVLLLIWTADAIALLVAAAVVLALRTVRTTSSLRSFETVDV